MQGSLQHLIRIAQAAHDLAPAPSQQMARRGLIAVALRASSGGEGDGFEDLCPPFVGLVPTCADIHLTRPLSKSMAATLAEALLVHAGNLEDPTDGALAAAHHAAEAECADLGTPCALIGDFVFFK